MHIYVKAYKAILHQKHMEEWLKLRNLDTKLALDTPKLGWICFYEFRPTAMVFLRKLENNYAFIDSLITNPCSSSEHRDNAINFLISDVIQKAHQKGFKQLFAHCVDENTLLRSDHFGFKKLPHTVLGLKLGV